MFQLASQIPTPILAEILGVAPKTAVRWAALAARDWGPYIALRQEYPVPHHADREGSWADNQAHGL